MRRSLRKCPTCGRLYQGRRTDVACPKCVAGATPTESEIEIPRVPLLKVRCFIESRPNILLWVADQVSKVSVHGSLGFEPPDDSEAETIPSLDGAVAKRVLDIIVTHIGEGKRSSEASEHVASAAHWPRWFAANVFHTCCSIDATMRCFANAAQVSMGGSRNGFQFSAVLDSDVRPNHALAHGLTAAWNDPVWNVLCPPLGPGCRCGLIPVIEFPGEPRLPRVGTVATPRGARPDSPAFGRRVDRRTWRLE